MGKTPAGHEPKTEATRALILAAARSTFVAAGYDATSIRNVARRAGISHGTIYLHFRDKDDLLYQVSEEEFGVLINRLRALPRTRDPIRRLGDTLREIGRFGLEFPHQYELILGPRPASFAEPGTPHFGPRAEQLGAFIGDLVREAQQRGFLLSTVGKLDELSLIAGVHGLVTMFAVQLIDRETAENAIDHIVFLLLSALTGSSCDIKCLPGSGTDSG